MVFKGRFFSSRHKSSESSSPDGSNSPRTPTSAPAASAASPASSSSSRSDKKKPKSETPKKRDKLFGSAAIAVPSPKSAASSATSSPSGDGRKGAASAAHQLRDAGGGGASAAALSPILASSLGLNRIKTRSGPLPQEGQRMAAALGSSNLARGQSQAGTSAASGGGFGKKGMSSWADSSSGGSSSNRGKGKAPEQPLRSASATGLGVEGKSSAKAKPNAFRNHSGDLRTPTHIPETCAYDTCETPKESESPRFKAIMQATSAPRKRNPSDIKSFSHELNSKGVRPFPFLKPRGLYNMKEVLKAIQVRFEKAKEEVNTDLAVFAGDLVSVMEKYADSHPEWKETLEDLLILARSCSVMTPGELWLQCEGIVQDLDDQRQELPMGVLKKLYTRMLFILTRCTRLLQFHKESGFAEDDVVMDQRDKIIQSADRQILAQSGPHDTTTRTSKTDARKSFSQEQHNLKWRRSQEIKPVKLLLPLDTDIKKDIESPTRERMSSWKPFPSPVTKPSKESAPIKEELPKKADTLSTVISGVELTSPVESISHQSLPPKHQHKTSWGHWSDQPNISEEGSIMCRICEEYVPTHYVENHSAICAIADRCDQKGVSVDERLVRVAETLEKMVESYSQKDLPNAVGSPDVVKVSNPSINEESDGPSPKLSDCSRRGSADMLDYLQEPDSTISLDDIKNLPSMTCKTRFGPKSDHGMATSSAGSMTPRSPLTTPRSNHIDMLLAGRSAINESNDLAQIVELADIARCIANTPLDEESALSQLVTCIEDLQEIVNRRKHEALTVQTFGTRIEKLHREKYLQLCDSVDMDKVDSSSTIMDEEDDVVRSLRASPVHPVKDRTSIDDFEIIKPISRGAFGRVFLAKKRTTGDLFAIKVLRKADMIRKNAVESILAERDILITVRNPFVVRFFYSFTSRENLYLVMEYLNGGDLYSLLRNLGCLDEDVARVYLAEVVLALEYLHSMQIVHRDLKPDNLLIAHDGHVKLTDFGLSKVGLINSTDDLSGPAVSGASLYGDDEPQMNEFEEMDHRARRQKRSAVGTPDYLAPEILLGTGHGTSADWWSVGVILFELLVGIPPFNAEHPQTIFDNILNRKIPWPHVPEEMSFEAKDLIDKFLTEDPHQRLGSNGASEVKQHPFFKDVSWDTLARQKAAFVPSSDSAFDTSYFTSRYSWNPSDENIYEAYEFEDSSDNGSLSGSSSCVSNHQDDMGDERGGGLTEFESGPNVNYSFSNFSFKNLSQLASINYDLLTKGLKDEPPMKSET
ncbi:probable serine/threonine protein kinase IREH1 isoform X2 [Brachypodium distachyon]|uniref:probable serine/threonine protein kinase IREH1 isoform X2 n=1 Tax=Brachypodium distachyon TaxID=15368 RepID=UPI000D0DEE78|nr:probable serine/threonine protein kinase IREH1 isoform X2 [Brachypodium distachyon]|eukprot:XP_024313399.1 probable serine/threonine protein kinase IREH1 isoform X2 [Brachypodium distachyon]